MDAGAEPEKILASVHQPVAAVFVTHGHADHVNALGAVLRETNAPLYVHPGDADRTGTASTSPRRRPGVAGRRGNLPGPAHAGTLAGVGHLRGR